MYVKVISRASKSTGARERRSQKKITDGRKKMKEYFKKRKGGAQNNDFGPYYG